MSENYTSNIEITSGGSLEVLKSIRDRLVDLNATVQQIDSRLEAMSASLNRLAETGIHVTNVTERMASATKNHAREAEKATSANDTLSDMLKRVAQEGTEATRATDSAYKATQSHTTAAQQDAAATQAQSEAYDVATTAIIRYTSAMGLAASATRAKYYRPEIGSGPESDVMWTGLGQWRYAESRFQQGFRAYWNKPELTAGAGGTGGGGAGGGFGGAGGGFGGAGGGFGGAGGGFGGAGGGGIGPGQMPQMPVMGWLDKQLSEWRRHLSWFIQGTIIYMGINAVLTTIRETIDGIVEATDNWSDAQAKLRINTGATQGQILTEYQGAYTGAQRYGASPQETQQLMIEATRLTGELAHNQDLVANSAQTMEIAEVGATEAIDMLVGIARQFNLTGAETDQVVDALAYTAKRGTDSVKEYADALGRSGGALRNAGYDFKEALGLIIGTTEMTERSGEQLGTLFQQVFTFNDAERQRLASLGIETTGRPEGEVFEEVARRFPSMNEEEQRTALRGLGGTRFQGDVRVMIENFGELQRAMAEVTNTEGEAAKRAEELGNSLAYARERAMSARQGYMQLVSTNIGLESFLTDFQRGKETLFLRPQMADMLKDMTPGQRQTFLTQYKNDFEAINPAYEMQRQWHISNVEEGGPIRGQMFAGLQYNDLIRALELLARVIQESAIRQEMTHSEYEDPAVRRAYLYGGRAPIDPSAYRSPLNLLGNQRFTESQAAGLQPRIEELITKFENAGYNTSDEVTRQILTGEGTDFGVSEISGPLEVIQIAVSEINERGKRLEGVWNLPGPAYVPLSSVDARPQAQNVAPIEQPVTPSVDAVEKVAEAMRLPLIAKGSEKREEDIISRKPISLQNKIILDEQIVGESASIVTGNELSRNTRAGGDYGGNYAPTVGGVF